MIRHSFRGLCNLFLFLVIFYNVASSQHPPTPVQKPGSIWSVAWNPNGQLIALGGDDSTVYLYNTKDYSLYKTFRSNSMVKGLSWHPRGQVLAVANMKGIQLLDLSSGKLNTLTHITTGGRAIGWNYTGELLGFADGRGVLQIMTREGTVLRSITKHDNRSFLTIDWHPSKNIVVVASDDFQVFDTSGKQLANVKHRKENTGILTAKWHPSGEFFAIGDYGHEGEGIPTLLQFWKEDGTLLKEMKGSKAEYRNIRWNRDGSLLATAGDELRLWSREGELIASGKTGYNLWGVSWSPSGDYIVTTDFDSHVDLWSGKAKLIKAIE